MQLTFAYNNSFGTLQSITSTEESSVHRTWNYSFEQVGGASAVKACATTLGSNVVTFGNLSGPTTEVAVGTLVEGQGIPLGTTVTAIRYNSSAGTEYVTLSNAATMTSASTLSFYYGFQTTGSTNGTTTINVTSTTSLIPGMTIVGQDIPAGTIVTAVNTNTKQITISAAAGSHTGETLQFQLAYLSRTDAIQTGSNIVTATGLEIGMNVAGVGIPLGARVTNIVDGSHVMISAKATATISSTTLYGFADFLMEVESPVDGATNSSAVIKYGYATYDLSNPIYNFHAITPDIGTPEFGVLVSTTGITRHYQTQGQALWQDMSLTTFTRTYYPNGRIFQVINGEGGTQTYSYDEVRNRTNVTDADGNTTTYSFDTLGRQTRVTYADQTSEIDVWDSNGLLSAHIDPLGLITKYVYGSTSPVDDDHRLGNMTEADEGNFTGLLETTSGRQDGNHWLDPSDNWTQLYSANPIADSGVALITRNGYKTVWALPSTHTGLIYSKIDLTTPPSSVFQTTPGGPIYLRGTSYDYDDKGNLTTMSETVGAILQALRN